MPLSDVVVLLPCHSLDDFPVYHEGEDASELLAAWSVIWHPALLATTRKAPRWARADSPPENLAESLFVVPQVSEPLLPADWMARAEREAGGVVRSLADRRQLAARLLERLDRVPGESDPDLIADFWSLGTTYLLTELLTRQMRYLSNFDEVSLGLAAVRAAQKGVAGDSAGARTELRECFEILLEARERFYPVDCYLLDLTLVEPTTLGSTLAQELDSTAAVNLLATGETLCELAERDPETLGLLKRALEAETADVIGGEATSADLPLLSLEAMLWQCERGARLYEQSIGYRPQVWGRRRYGLAVGWPQVLNRWGFVAALHGALDAGQYPRGSQAKIRWEGFDGSAIDALARVPVDVRSDESILLFPARMGESMDLDHVATVMLAHWPGDASPFYEDLRRTARYVPVLGRFVTAQEYFRHTDAAGRLTRFEADQYRTPYLKEAVAAGQADPLSRYVRHLEAEQWLACCATFDTWTASLRGVVASHHELVERVGKQMPPAVMTREPELWTALRATLQSSAQALAERLGAGTLLATTQREVLVLNPLATSRDVVVSWPDSSGEQARGTVPGCGFAWLRAEAPPPPKLPRRFGRAPEQASHLLSNGQMRVRVDEQTGGIRSVHGPARFRGNRLTQQIAFPPHPATRPGDI